MILAQISDTHILLPGDPRAAARAGALRRCVADINALEPRVDAVIHTGDMTQNGAPGEFAHAGELLAALHAPLYRTPGNRDGRGGATDAPFVHYAVDGHGVRLVAVDSLSAGEAKGDFCAARLDALDATLAAAPDRPTALFMHHPPFDVPAAKDPFQYRRRAAAEELAAVISRHRQVIRIFCGHAHRAWQAGVGGVAASTMPCIATDLRRGDYPAAMAGRPVYQLHRFQADTGFVSETRIVDG